MSCIVNDHLAKQVVLQVIILQDTFCFIQCDVTYIKLKYVLGR